MTSILLLGLFLGMQHALEADHLAAVSSVVVGESSFQKFLNHSAVWGIGHTVTLLLLAGSTFALGIHISEPVASLLESFVGLMLIYLGGSVIWRYRKKRLPFHLHQSVKEEINGARSGNPSEAVAAKESRFSIRTLLVGMTHGIAGSSALVVIVAASAQSVTTGLTYVLVFGFGSILGMTALFAAIALPIFKFKKPAHRLFKFNLSNVVGLWTMAIGVQVLFETSHVLAIY